MELVLYNPDTLPTPGKCARCGNVNSACVDLGFDIEDDLLAQGDRIYGRNAALLCISCLAEMSAFLPTPEADTSEADSKFKTILIKIGEHVDALANIMYSPASDFGIEPVAESVVDKEATKSTKKRTSSAPVESNESSSGKGPDDVSSPGSDGDSKDSGIESLVLFK